MKYIYIKNSIIKIKIKKNINKNKQNIKKLYKS